MDNKNNEEIGYIGLANAIVVRAVKDYQLALKKGHDSTELENFFLSGWFLGLSGLDGEDVMEAIRKSTVGGKK